MRRRAVAFVFLAICLSIRIGSAEDWPMWRYDAGRTAASPQQLPDELHLQWTRTYPPLVQAWEDPLNRDLMQFDRVYEPVVVGHTMLIGSSACDRLVALDTATGDERWAFHAGGPIRLPAVATAGSVYFASDDGYLYCLDVTSGRLKWKFRGGPQNLKVLGNSRLVSAWPARGGPVLAGGVIYFAAGIWPFMGVFIHALDAETGELIWTNDSSGSLYIRQPHNSPAYGGVAPQGSMVVSGDYLLIPCGRSVPAGFDRHTGELIHYKLSQNNKTGGAFVCAIGDRFVNYHRDGVTSLYDLTTGDAIFPRFGRVPVATADRLFCSGDTIATFDLGGLRQVPYDRAVKDKETGEVKIVEMQRWVMDPLWRSPVDASGDLIKSGDRLYAGGKGRITVLDLADSGPPTVAATLPVEGTVRRLLTADDRLFAVTESGRIYTFGAESVSAAHHAYLPQEPRLDKKAAQRARRILQATGVDEGYCLVYALKDGKLIEALAALSDLRIIAIDPDARKVDRLRRSFTDAGLYGNRVSLLVGDPTNPGFPPYMASLTLFEDESRKFPPLETVYRSMRPYGGFACFPAEMSGTLVEFAERDPQIRLRHRDDMILLSREGPLPGAADWTHQYGDVANTVKSDDRLVRLPLGLLWFGGNSNDDVLPRHGHGPPEQVIGGRLFIEGIDLLSARDVYTGRVLWKRELPGLGISDIYIDSTYFYAPLSTSYNQVHIPGANARGTNFVATGDRIYVARQRDCLVLDPVTGETLDEILLPAIAPGDSLWGYIGVYEDLLIAGSGQVSYTDFLDLTPEQRRKSSYNLDTNSSHHLLVMDRYSGEFLWSYTSAQGLRHNAIVAGAGKIFCIDNLSPMVAEALSRRGKPLPENPLVLAFDARTGAEVWRVAEDVFGTWLGYSEERDLLLQAGRKTRDTIADEPSTGMAVYRGEDGARLWHRADITYGGPCILHGDRIITDRHAYSLLTGEQIMRQSPLTGEEEPWAFTRRYGCNYNIASEYLLTFRSAAAGFYDLEHDGGTGNFGGFKSGCTSNLIAADGVLNAPDYTRTCACSYQNQTSLAMVHMPDVELWVTYLGENGEGPIREIGINLGAPGNRRDRDGTFWIAHPLLPHVENSEKESGITAAVEVEAERGGFYTRHASFITDGDGPDWVAASGCQGLTRLELDLRAPADAVYRVDLHFAEPENNEPGERLFDVLLEGREVLRNFDIAARSGGTGHSLVQSFPGIPVSDGKLTVELHASRPHLADEKYLPLLSGLKVVREN